MQALFTMDMQHRLDPDMFDRFCANFPPSEQARAFLVELVTGVLREKERIDGIIEQFSSNWKLPRMSCVDRNILRLAVYELLFRSDIPAKVSINEAIDIGKKYGTDESGAFINGILDSIRLALEQEAIPWPKTEPTI